MEGKGEGLFESRFIGRRPWESGCELFTSETFLARERGSQCTFAATTCWTCWYSAAMERADRVDPDALQRFVVFRQRQTPKRGEGVKPQNLCIAKDPKHTSPAPFTS